MSLSDRLNGFSCFLIVNMNLRSLSFFPSFFSFLFFSFGGLLGAPTRNLGARWLVEALAARAKLGGLGYHHNSTAARGMPPIPSGFTEPGGPGPNRDPPSGIPTRMKVACANRRAGRPTDQRTISLTTEYSVLTKNREKHFFLQHPPAPPSAHKSPTASHSLLFFFSKQNPKQVLGSTKPSSAFFQCPTL